MSLPASRSVVFALVAVAAVTSGVMLAQPPQAVGTWASLGEIALPSGPAITWPDGRTLIVGESATLSQLFLVEGVR